NGERSATALRWRATDSVCGAASIVFARGWPRSTGARLCPNILVRGSSQPEELILLHRCDLSAHAIPLAAASLLHDLWRGEASELDPQLRDAGLMHDPE